MYIYGSVYQYFSDWFFSFFVLFPQLPLRHLSNTAIDEKRINQSHSQYIILLPTLGETNFRE